MARSVAAIVHGYRSFDPDVDVAGVILNRLGSEYHAELLREALEPLGVAVLGAVPRDCALEVPERHLGLVPAVERATRARAVIARLAATIEQHCDLAGLLALARSAGPLAEPAWSPAPRESDAITLPSRRPRVAVAAGPAFSFHYEENLELLRAAGAELVPFDPTIDEALPAGSKALLLAGGFPEVFGEQLSANAPLLGEIGALARRRAPILAECGGLLYLSKRLDGRPMCGVLDLEATMGERLSLGYREAVAVSHHPVWPAGTTTRGHEFHYSTVSEAANGTAAWWLRARGTERTEGHVAGGVHASYLHTHWAATPEVAGRLVRAASAVGAAPGVPR
jgi:cobyrinic acid a,c-diamide synthase